MSKIPLLRSSIFLTLFAIGTLSSESANAQSALFSELVDSDHDGVTLYFYPSTVRVILQMIMGDEVNRKKIGSIKRGRVIYSSAGNSALSKKIEQILKGENDEGFSILMEIDNRGNSVSVMEKGGKDPITLLFLSDYEAQYAVEIEGEITQQMLMKVMSSDVGAAAAQLGIGPSEESDSEPEETENEPSNQIEDE